jgi:hypothetical protein
MKPIFDNSILEELKPFCDQTESEDGRVKGRFRTFYLFHYSPYEVVFLYRNDFTGRWMHAACYTLEEYKSNFYLLKKQYFDIKEKEMKKKLKRIDKDF